MCTVCGCGAAPTHTAHDHAVGEHVHVLADGTVLVHRHDPEMNHAHHDPQDDEPTRLIRLEQDILAKNRSVAALNRRLFAAQGIFALNLMSSPGAGKTSLLVRTLIDFAGRHGAAVIEGDQQTSFDADRIGATGTPALQINTGKACHLDAAMVNDALGKLGALSSGFLFIENVGNLVCPAGFDLGESRRVVIVSITEGEDKPLKYPGMFAAADLVVVTKIDLLPHLRFDLDRLIAGARQISPEANVVCVSAETGAGLDQWYSWLEAGLGGVRHPTGASANAEEDTLLLP